MARGARAGRTLALVLAALVALLGLAVAPRAALAEDCEVDQHDPLCNPVDTTTESTTTSTTVVTTTTTEAVTTTTERQTATTARQTTTTRAPAETTTTLETVTTESNVLIAGDGTEGAESTTTTLATATTVSDDGLSDGTLIALVIAGLLLIAVVVAILTWRYWVATRPPLAAGDPEPPRRPPARRPAPVR